MKSLTYFLLVLIFWILDLQLELQSAEEVGAGEGWVGWVGWAGDVLTTSQGGKPGVDPKMYLLWAETHTMQHGLLAWFPHVYCFACLRAANGKHLPERLKCVQTAVICWATCPVEKLLRWMLELWLENMSLPQRTFFRPCHCLWTSQILLKEEKHQAHRHDDATCQGWKVMSDDVWCAQRDACLRATGQAPEFACSGRS